MPRHSFICHSLLRRTKVFYPLKMLPFYIIITTTESHCSQYLPTYLYVFKLDQDLGEESIIFTLTAPSTVPGTLNDQYQLNKLTNRDLQTDDFQFSWIQNLGFSTISSALFLRHQTILSSACCTSHRNSVYRWLLALAPPSFINTNGSLLLLSIGTTQLLYFLIFIPGFFSALNVQLANWF